MVHSGLKVTTFKERFSELFDESEHTATELAKKLHVSKQTLSAWRSGKRSPKEPTIIAIANFFGVDAVWLMGFDVEKSVQSILPPNITPISQMIPQRLPMIGSVAAGEPILAAEDWDLYIDAPAKADYALRVEGDSMEPTYLNGDIVYIRSTPDVPDGTVGVVLIDDSATMKHIYHIPNGVLLTSDNPAYKPMRFTWPDYDTIRILGAVVGYTRLYGNE